MTHPFREEQVYTMFLEKASKYVIYEGIDSNDTDNVSSRKEINTK